MIFLCSSFLILFRPLLIFAFGLPLFCFVIYTRTLLIFLFAVKMDYVDERNSAEFETTSLDKLF